MRRRTRALLTARDSESADSEEARLVRSDRAVSPVVGVALLIAVTVVLGLAIGPFILGTAGDLVSDTPEGEFAFFYDEDVAFEPDDSFGMSITEGEGMMVLKMERGDTLDPANVEIIATTSGGNLLEDTPDEVYGPDDRIRPGDTIDVVVNRGERVQVVWTAPDGDSSVVLGDLTVPGPSSVVPPGVPSPNLGCDWVDGVISNDDFEPEQGDDFDAGDVVACDVSVDGHVGVDGDLTIVGSISAGSVTLGPGEHEDGGDVYGSIQSDGSIDLENLTVTDNLQANMNVTLDDVTAEGDIDAGEDAEITDSTVDGDVVVDGTLTLTDSTITGHVDATKIDCNGDSMIAGEECETYPHAKFDISITATTFPGVTDEPFKVETVIENVRIEERTEKIVLDVDGEQDSESVTLDGGESTLEVFEWTPESADTYTINVTTEDPDRHEPAVQLETVEEDIGDRPIVNEFDVSTGGDSITVDWDVSSGSANLSFVGVELVDSDGEFAGAESWFLNDEEASFDRTFDELDAGQYSVKLEIDDQDNQFVREIEVVEVG